MTTIHQLARLCGVSAATVSRVFNNPQSVRRETREHVERIARELDYRPNESARTLSQKKSNLIGVVWDTDHRRTGWRHPYLQEILVGLKSALSSHGYHLLLLATSDDGDERKVGASLANPVAYLNAASRHNLGGLILIDSGADGPAFTAFAASGLPCVAIDVPIMGPRATYVTSANDTGAAAAVAHLHRLGHRRIATISGPRHTLPGARRLEGFLAAMTELELSIPDEYRVEGDFYLASGHTAMRELLALPRPPTAVFVAGDEMAVGALRAAREVGARVPDDVAIVGFDDIESASVVSPALSTVAQDKAGFGAAAAEAVLAMITPNRDAPTPEPIVLGTELVIRESCGGTIATGPADGKR